MIAPRPSASITWARGEYESIRGTIKSYWQLRNGTLHLEITVPANTTATVRVPVTQADAVTESGKPAGKAEAVKFLRGDKDAVVYEVGSGRYVFEAPCTIGKAKR